MGISWWHYIDYKDLYVDVGAVKVLNIICVKRCWYIGHVFRNNLNRYADCIWCYCIICLIACRYQQFIVYWCRIYIRSVRKSGRIVTWSRSSWESKTDRIFIINFYYMRRCSCLWRRLMEQKRSSRPSQKSITLRWRWLQKNIKNILTYILVRLNSFANLK